MTKSVVLSLLALLCAATPMAMAAAKKDRDHDKIPDRWEKRHGLKTNAKSGKFDPDHDGLRNRGEYKARTHPRRKDTDRDGLRDGPEVKKYKTNPRRKDTDRDGLRDGAEVKKYKTNPRKKDTDGDGFSDGVEVKAGTNPRDPNSHPPRNAPAAGGFPTPFNTGVPGGWTPKSVHTGRDVQITTPGAVIQDVQYDNVDVYVLAPNVTLRRVKIRGGRLLNASGPDCAGQGMLVEDSTIEPPPGQSQPAEEPYVVGEGGYTLRRVKIWNVGDGPRVSYRPEGCGAVNIQNTFISVTQAGHSAWHTDGLQAYYGNHLNISNVTIDARGDRLGTSAAFFYPNQNNTSATIDRLLLFGGAYSFRLGTPGTVTGLKVVDDSWLYGPLDSKCRVITKWDAAIVTATSAYQVASTVRPLRCSTPDGGE